MYGGVSYYRVFNRRATMYRTILYFTVIAGDRTDEIHSELSLPSAQPWSWYTTTLLCQPAALSTIEIP